MGTTDAAPRAVRPVVLAVLVLSLAGCLSAIGGGDAPTERPQCKLMHEVVDPTGEYADATETFAYENLSDEAQQVFDEALTGGSYATTNQRVNPPEFRYWDTVTSYNITYENETHKLLTYTGEGCEQE